ncbi:MAG: hypothetical protein ABIG96_02875, partial [Candidatus Micrarchaeota archaeon]
KESIAPYSFIWFLICDKETAYYHRIASVILSNGINHLPNAYNLALFHARRSVELEPTNVDNLQWLLFFNILPDKLISDEEAVKIARKVLRYKPNDKASLDVLEKVKK